MGTELLRCVWNERKRDHSLQQCKRSIIFRKMKAFLLKDISLAAGGGWARGIISWHIDPPMCSFVSWDPLLHSTLNPTETNS